MSGETDLAAMLASLEIERRGEPVTVLHLEHPVELGEGLLALITEEDATTAVVSIAEAERRGWPVDFRGAWLTVSVHSSLEALAG